MTGQNDRQDRSLTGQVRNQAGHCPLTGRYLQPCNEYLLINVSDKDKPEDRQGAVYKIKCCDRQATYINNSLWAWRWLPHRLSNLQSL